MTDELGGGGWGLGGGCQTVVENRKEWLGGCGAGWTSGTLLPLSSEALRRRQSYDRRGSMGSTSGMSILQRETLSRCEITTGQITTDMSAII